MNISLDEAVNGTQTPFVCVFDNRTIGSVADYWWICLCDVDDDCDLCWLLLLLLCCCLVPLAALAKRRKDAEEEDLPTNNFTKGGTIRPKSTPMFENPMFDDADGEYLDPASTTPLYVIVWCFVWGSEVIYKRWACMLPSDVR